MSCETRWRWGRCLGTWIINHVTSVWFHHWRIRSTTHGFRLSLQESLWYLNWAYMTEDTGQNQKCRCEVTEIALESDNMTMELEDSQILNTLWSDLIGFTTQDVKVRKTARKVQGLGVLTLQLIHSANISVNFFEFTRQDSRGPRESRSKKYGEADGESPSLALLHLQTQRSVWSFKSQLGLSHITHQSLTHAGTFRVYSPTYSLSKLTCPVLFSSDPLLTRTF